jgi:hypothetical protein
LNCKVREDQVFWDYGNFGSVFAIYDRPLLAESGLQFQWFSGCLNVRFREKRTFRIKAGNIVNSSAGERPLSPQKRTLG